MPRDGIDQIETILHSLRGSPGRDHSAAVRVDRERKFLGVGVVRARDVVELVVRVVRPCEIPTREYPRAGVHVGFRKRPDAHREELHQLSREVLLGPAADIQTSVEPHQHRGVLRDRDQQIAEIAESVLSEQFELADDGRGELAGLRREHARRVDRANRATDFRIGSGEVVVPEQRHLLLQRALAVHHPEQPPLPGIVDVGLRLETTRCPGGHAHVAGTADLVVHVVREPLEVEQPLDGRDVRHRRVSGDVLLGRPDRCTPQQVFDVLLASPRHGHGLQTGRRRVGGYFSSVRTPGLPRRRRGRRGSVRLQDSRKAEEIIPLCWLPCKVPQQNPGRKP
jgi:hypothetical protein